MLEVRDLTVQYGYGRRILTAVDRVSFAVPAGGTLAIVGESGSGKSTIARAVVGLLPLAGGSIHLGGADWTARRHRAEFRRKVQMVFQDPYSSLNPRMTIGDALDETLATRSEMSRKARKPQVLRLLELVGLPSTSLPRYPHEFSGGQRQRIAIARALAAGPDVVICDEVTSALDVSVQATILNLLKDLQRELRLSYVIISHDLAVVGIMSDVVAVMYLGRIVESADAAALFARPCHPYSRALIESAPSFTAERTRAAVTGELPDPRNPPSGCRFRSRCPVGPLARPERTICIDEDPQQGSEAREHQAACHFAGDADAQPRSAAPQVVAR